MVECFIPPYRRYEAYLVLPTPRMSINCLGNPGVEIGQKRLPIPPAIITTCVLLCIFIFSYFKFVDISNSVGIRTLDPILFWVCITYLLYRNQVLHPWHNARVCSVYMAYVDNAVLASHLSMTLIHCLAQSWYYAQEWALPFDLRSSSSSQGIAQASLALLLLRSSALVKFPLREALEEIASGVFEDARLNNEHAGDICFNYFHCKLIND